MRDINECARRREDEGEKKKVSHRKSGKGKGERKKEEKGKKFEVIKVRTE